MDFLKVEGHSNLVRDKKTNSIINTNMIEYDEYIARKFTKNEEATINKYLESGGTKISIIIYGKNANDETTYKKYYQLSKLGFTNVSVYPGGLFEWLLLQDIYGVDEFTTTSKQLDILKYKPRKTLHAGLIGYYAS